MFICQSAQSSQYDKLIPGICQLTANFETVLHFVIQEATQKRKTIRLTEKSSRNQSFC
jgi:hypothetical protein